MIIAIPTTSIALLLTLLSIDLSVSFLHPSTKIIFDNESISQRCNILNHNDVMKSKHYDGTTTTTTWHTTTRRRLVQMKMISSFKNKMINVPTIHDWTIDEESNQITGNVYGSRKKINGEEIRTSPILTDVNISSGKKRNNFQQGDIVMTTSGSKYQLGLPKKKPNNEDITTASSKNESFFSSIRQALKRNSNRATSPFDSLPKKSTIRPKSFAAIPPSTYLQFSQNSNNSDERIPVLDDWYLDTRTEGLVGIISNSPIVSEEDGNFISTAVVATDFAFVYEGFTVLTVDGRKYKLGIPKVESDVIGITSPIRTSSGSGRNNNEVNPWNTPILDLWDVQESSNSNGNRCIYIIGIIQNTNDPDIPNGQLITTDEVITSREFLDDGFSIVTAVGLTYKLGTRDRVGKKRQKVVERDIQFYKGPKVISPFGKSSGVASSDGDERRRRRSTTSVDASPSRRVKAQKLQQEQSIRKSTIALPGTFAIEGEENEFSIKKEGDEDISIPVIDDWTLTNGGNIIGILTNSQDPDKEDGGTITTSKVTSFAIEEGKIIETINGSLYKLGREVEDGNAVNTLTEGVSESSIPIRFVRIIGGATFGLLLALLLAEFFPAEIKI